MLQNNKFTGGELLLRFLTEVSIQSSRGLRILTKILYFPDLPENPLNETKCQASLVSDDISQRRSPSGDTRSSLCVQAAPAPARRSDHANNVIELLLIPYNAHSWDIVSTGTETEQPQCHGEPW